MRKTLLTILSLLVVFALVAACAPKPTEAPAEEPVEEPAEEPEAFTVGMVTDMGGIDDKSFNQTSWLGLEMAEDELGVEASYLESSAQTDYGPNITQYLDQDTDLIVTVGFMLGEDTATFAKANPDVDFAIVDFAYDPTIDNVLGLVFATDQAAFLAGYLAAGMTQTGKVGTFGGVEIPSVTIFMVGMNNGIEFYNEQHGTDVEMLGINLFTGNFDSTDDGRRFAEDLIAEGADIIMPVAGPVGLGTAAAIQENPGTMLIGVDTDWCVSAAEYCDVTLASVLKKLENAVFEATRQSQAGNLEGGLYVGTLENGGVGLSSFNEFDDDVPDDLKAELEEVQQDLISGAIDTGWPPGEEEEEATAGGIGSADSPIKVLFVPSVDTGVIVSGGEVMREALEAATGLAFEVSVPTSYAATIEAMCASPEDTIGFIPALGYVIANQKCGVEVGSAAVRYGWSVYWAQYLVARDSDYETLEDLAGLKWAVPDLGSTSGYLVPLTTFEDLGIEIGEVVEAGGHPQDVLAVYNGEVDFATTYFSAPLTDPAWQVGDDPEPYDPMEVAMSEEGTTFAGDVRVLDARTAVIETAPDIFQKVRIMTLTDPIPNDTMSFSPDFPDELKASIIDALVEFTASEACLESICSDQFYNWTGLEPIEDSAYDVTRRLIQGLGYTEEDIFGG